MRKFFSTLVVILLGVLFVVFAVANRHFVTVSLDPFDSASPSITLPPVPLFVVIIVSAILGVAVGGTATWFRQRHWRRAARQHEADARRARSELGELRAVSVISRGGTPQLAAPAPRGIYGSAGRDK